jgi:hypothetical protein
MRASKYLVPRLFPVGPSWRSGFGEKCLFCSHIVRVSEGTRTPDRLDHNQELYQLSYAHQVRRSQSSDVSDRLPAQRA